MNFVNSKLSWVFSAEKKISSNPWLIFYGLGFQEFTWDLEKPWREIEKKIST